MTENWMIQAMEYVAEGVPALAAFLLRSVICIVVYCIGKRAIAWAVRAVRRMLERAKMQAGAITFSTSIVKIALYAILALWIAMQFGVKESSVAALLASAGVAIGLAFQGGLSNLAGGFLILLFQPFQVGDYIITQGQEGTVQKIEIMYTTLLTADTRRVIVPNGTLADNVIVNVTAADKRKLELKVTISYKDDLLMAKAVLERLIQENPDVLHEEETRVFVSALGDNGVALGLHCWVPTEKYFPVFWRMNEQIKLEFDRVGLHLSCPQVEVHMAADKAEA